MIPGKLYKAMWGTTLISERGQTIIGLIKKDEVFMCVGRKPSLEANPNTNFPDSFYTTVLTEKCMGRIVETEAAIRQFVEIDL